MKPLSVRHCIVCLFALLLLTLTAHAARVDDLFQVEVAAAGRDAGSRDAALRQALGQVLLRITGTAESLSEPSLRPLLKNPSRFAQQFRFRDIPTESRWPAKCARRDYPTGAVNGLTFCCGWR
jgi:hypothetical protein